MLNSRRVLVSVVCGVIITVVLSWAAFSLESGVAGSLLLWPCAILNLAIGPGPILGYDEQGNPMYEGTPVIALAAFLSIFLAVPVNSFLSYVALTIFEGLRARKLS